MKNTLLLFGLAFSFTAFGQALYEEGFEDFAAGDYISDHPMWITWGAGQEGTDGDAQISSDFANTGDNSLHIFATSAAGGRKHNRCREGRDKPSLAERCRKFIHQLTDFTRHLDTSC